MKQYEHDQLRVERRVAAKRARESVERLERIATAALQGLMISPGMLSAEGIAQAAVRYAKALIAELDKQP